MTTSIRELLESMDESVKRPADKDVGDKTAASVKEVSAQQVDGTNGNAHSDRSADKSTGEVKPEAKGTVAKTETDSEQKGKGTEVQGNTYGEETVSGAAKLSIVESLQVKLDEDTGFKVDVSGLKGLFEAQDLSEEFATQASEIFEAAVNDIAQAHIAKLNDYAAYVIESEIEAQMTSIEEAATVKIDEAIATWSQENKLAIDTGIRLQVAESFMSKMKSLFEDHYIDMPEAKTDMYESAIQKGEEIYEELTEQKEINAQLEEELASLRKQVVVEGFVSKLTDTKAEKIRSLAEGLDFSDKESFESKLSILAEGYVSESKSAVDSTLVEDTAPAVIQESVETKVDPEMAALMAAVTKYNGKR